MLICLSAWDSRCIQAKKSLSAYETKYGIEKKKVVKYRKQLKNGKIIIQTEDNLIKQQIEHYQKI